jgi:hypothetical protein
MFEELVQQIKMQKLMSYQPKVISLDDEERERLQRNFG